MFVYRSKELDLTGAARAHPWAIVGYEGAQGAYVDFRQHPEKIASSLEDFHSWEQYPAVNRFYELLRWLNGSESYFETNDCAFRLKSNTDSRRPYKLQASGRLMLFASDLRLTCQAGFIAWVMEAFQFYLAKTAQIETAVIGVSQAPCYFVAAQTEAYELVFYFWVWGDSEAATMESFKQMIDCLEAACREVNVDIKDALQRRCLIP